MFEEHENILFSINNFELVEDVKTVQNDIDFQDKEISIQKSEIMAIYFRLKIMRTTIDKVMSKTLSDEVRTMMKKVIDDMENTLDDVKSIKDR